MTLDLEGMEDKTEQEMVVYLHDLYLKGASSKQLAKALDVTDVTIRNYFNKYGLSIKRHGGQYTGKHVKITEKEYLKFTTKELMQKYNCSQFTIYNLTKHFKSRCGRNKKYETAIPVKQKKVT